MKTDIMIRIVMVATVVAMVLGCTKNPGDDSKPPIPNGMGEVTLGRVRLEYVSPEMAEQRASRATATTRATGVAMPAGSTLRLYAFKTGVIDFTQLITSRTYTVSADGSAVLDPNQDPLYLPVGAVDVYVVGPLKHNIGTAVAPNMVDIAAPQGVYAHQGADLIAAYSTANIVPGDANALPAMVLTHKMARVQVVVERHESAAYENMVVEEVKLFGQPTEGTYTLDPDGGTITTTSDPKGDIVFAQVTEETAKERYSITTVLLPQAEREMKIETTFSCNQMNKEAGDAHPTIKYRQSGLITAELAAGTATQFSTKPLTPIEIKWRTKVLPWNAVDQESIVIGGIEIVRINPPTADQWVEIDGLKWTKGNLVAVSNDQCQVGTPTDYGLYFQFGSLIGWAGGDNGYGTGTATNGSALSQKVKPTGYIGGTGWTTSGYYTGGSSLNTGYGLPSTDAPATGIGDPCRYYLGDPWRTPTADEYLALVGSNGQNTDLKVPLKVNSYDLTFPGSGFRDPNTGALTSVGSQGFYWSSSVSSGAHGLHLNFAAGNVSPRLNLNRVRGFTSRCVSGTYLPPFKVNPPEADQVVEIDGLKWTKGNLVASNVRECKVGAPTDYGLYFHFGSLIGWTGGANGDGTGAGSPAELSQKVKPTEYSGSATWPAAYYTGGTSANTGYALPLTDAPSSGIGDPCRYYLGAPWRTPTTDEYKVLCNQPNATTNQSFDWSAVGGSWSTSPAGGNFASNKLFFPVSGYREESAGALDNVGSQGYCWSSSIYTISNCMRLRFSAGSVSPQNYNSRVGGFTSRCVSGTLIPPFKVNPPTADQVVEIDGLKWTKGNLVAAEVNQCKVGAPTDYGLYFHFGSLIGWTGGANGDGTGAVTNVALSQKVKPTGYSGGTGWTTSGYYKDGTIKDTGYGLPSSDAPATGIGDACRYYLGSPWRTPTADEYTALLGANGENTNKIIPLKVNLYDLTFLGSGFREPNAGALESVGSQGIYWSSSIGSSTNGLNLTCGERYVYPQHTSARVYGFTSRCVSGTYVKPLKWATGNLVADGANDCKIGEPTDYGLYFHFGSLVGWTGGANGDGTGVTTTVALSQKVKPSGYTGSPTWPAGYYMDGTENTGYDLPTTDDATTGIGDACRYYLGSPWRTPKLDEYIALVGADGDKTDKGVPLTVSGLAFPGSGSRNRSTGAFGEADNGLYWSSSIYSDVSGYRLLFSVNSVFTSSGIRRQAGYPLRCVQ